MEYPKLYIDWIRYLKEKKLYGSWIRYVSVNKSLPNIPCPFLSFHKYLTSAIINMFNLGEGHVLSELLFMDISWYPNLAFSKMANPLSRNWHRLFTDFLEEQKLKKSFNASKLSRKLSRANDKDKWS